MSQYTLNELLALPLPESESEIDALSGDELLEQYTHYIEITELIDSLRNAAYSRERDSDIEKLLNKIKPFESLYTELLFPSTEDAEAPLPNELSNPKIIDNANTGFSEYKLERIREIADELTKIPDSPAPEGKVMDMTLIDLARYITKASLSLTNERKTNWSGRAKGLINLNYRTRDNQPHDRFVFKQQALAEYLKNLTELQEF